PRGRVALCGAIAQYNETIRPPGPSNLVLAIGLGLTLRGFITPQYQHRHAEFRREMAASLASGRIRHDETKVKGIENAATAFIGLCSGANTGKMLVEVEG